MLFCIEGINKILSIGAKIRSHSLKIIVISRKIIIDKFDIKKEHKLWETVLKWIKTKWRINDAFRPEKECIEE